MKKLNFAVNALVALFMVTSVAGCSSVFKQKNQLFVQLGKSANYDGKSSLKVVRVAASANKDGKSDLNANVFAALKAKKVEKNLIATVSFSDKKGKKEVATVEIIDAKFDKAAAVYNVKIVNGKMLKEMRDVSIFVENYRGKISN